MINKIINHNFSSLLKLVVFAFTILLTGLLGVVTFTESGGNTKIYKNNSYNLTYNEIKLFLPGNEHELVTGLVLNEQSNHGTLTSSGRQIFSGESIDINATKNGIEYRPVAEYQGSDSFKFSFNLGNRVSNVFVYNFDITNNNNNQPYNPCASTCNTGSGSGSYGGDFDYTFGGKVNYGGTGDGGEIITSNNLVSDPVKIIAEIVAADPSGAQEVGVIGGVGGGDPTLLVRTGGQDAISNSFEFSLTSGILLILAGVTLQFYRLKRI
jgi:hypothetical protein